LHYRPDQIDFFRANVPIALDVEHVVSLSHDITIVTLAQAYTETACERPDGSWGPGLSHAYTQANNPFGMRWFEEYHKDDPLPRFTVRGFWWAVPRTSNRQPTTGNWYPA